MRGSLLVRLATWIVAFVVGGVYGLAGTIAHSYTLGWFPLGLVLAVIGCGALLAAVRLLTGDRWAALATGLGMVAATLFFSGKGPGGSVIVPETALATVWTLALPILVLIVVVWPDRVGALRGN
ncbi:histidinol dehydrogenase [Microbacterium pumilum]|uniref:Histidinol dehydrogenase n=1 Tax=Microbacterium pumilum TaxID=344165 RepID=A0ABN2SU22_9MICO